MNAPAYAIAPGPHDTPVFREPWQAHAFAMVVALHRQGLFSWREWTDALSAQIATAAAPDSDDAYYRHWLGALEGLVAAKVAGSAEPLRRTRAAWARAAARTPHGQPIELAAGDFDGP